MKKNIYYQQVYRRENLFKNFIFDSAMKIASYPKLLLEVFLRRNFGERYFSIATTVTVALFMLFAPIVFHLIVLAADIDYTKRPTYWANYASCHVCMIVFIIFAIIRWREVKRNPSVFDFKRFSLYTGDISPFFYNLKFFGKRPSDRTIEIYLEPAVCFIVAFILYVSHQLLGTILIFSSFMYALSYAGQYKKGDDFVMDKIDEIIMNEELEDAFVNDETADKTRGVRFYSNKPKSKAMRKKVADQFVESDLVDEEITYAD